LRHSRLPTRGADNSGRFVETPSEGIRALRSHSCECKAHEMQLGCGALRTDLAPARAVDLIDFQNVLRPRVESGVGLEAVAIFWRCEEEQFTVEICSELCTPWYGTI